jgi:hypothetical protein
MADAQHTIVQAGCCQRGREKAIGDEEMSEGVRREEG